MSKLEVKIAGYTDEKCLKEFSKFLDRVKISCKLIETEEGLLTHQVLMIQCGDKAIVSEPDEFEWPLQRLPMPEAMKGMLN